MRPFVDPQLVRDVISDAQLGYAYYTFMALSGVLAAVAFLTDSIPLLLGAMIVAPAYPPLAAISFSLTGGYPRVAGRALLALSGGIGIAVVAAIATTWFCNITGLIASDMNLIDQPLLEERVRTGWYSVLAAVAAGIAGTIAVIKRKQDTLIGIVASIALVPAAAAGGIAMYAGDAGRGIGGFLLLLVNVCVIVALGLVVLLVIRPGPEEPTVHQEQEDELAPAKTQVARGA